MQRIANPGSDLDMIVRIFRDLHEILRSRPDFDLDDMTLAMIQRNNVSSQGAFGELALERSTRADRSRDPLYNQSKMYAELFRAFGWLQSTTSALRFSFSWLGEHVAEATVPKPLVLEGLLGWSYPNEVISTEGGQTLQYFVAVLRAAEDLGGRISRDEMIVGPLMIQNDRDTAEWQAMITTVQRCRASKAAMDEEIARIGTARNIRRVTMENYTRFVIGATQWAGWFHKSKGYLVLTETGRAALAAAQSMFQARLSDYQALPIAAQAPFVRYTAYRMLARAGFDITPVTQELAADRATIEYLKAMPPGDILFSPFQLLARDKVNAAFPHLAATKHTCGAAAERAFDPSAFAQTARVAEAAHVRFEWAGEVVAADDETEALAAELRAALAYHGNNIEATVATFAGQHASDNQHTFYPLVAALFRLLSFKCQMSRKGHNYDRADAMIVDPEESIPIEIKSPGEEVELSVKGVRQALENKVLLLSRSAHPTRPETTSLVVGFNPPNERSEVWELVDNIYTTFQIRIGVLDFRTIVRLVLMALSSGRQVVLQDFRAMKGVLDVDCSASDAR